MKNGDCLPLVGGPYDGSHRRVEYIFPFLDGGLPPAGLWFGNHLYKLDKVGERWVYIGVAGDASERIVEQTPVSENGGGQ